MKAVVLAGGYATRLYPLTRDRPKHLLEVGGRPIIELLLERLPLDELDAVYVVTNAKFAERFREWSASYPADVVVLDDGTTSEDDRLGAIGDLQLAIESEGLDDDLIVAAGDSIFTDRLDDFARFGQERDAAAIAVYDIGDLEEMKRLSSIGVDEDSRLVTFEEKPENPESTLAGIALYFYPRAVLPLVGRYLAEGNNPDQPGRLIGWLYERTPVYAWRVPGQWFDIGTPETLAEAEQLFETN
ncbi:MAG TPA: nucleotidyltransferase family protein [Gaiellaceae bacterium]